MSTIQETFPYADHSSIRDSDWLAVRALIRELQQDCKRSPILRSVGTFLSLVDVLRAYEESLVNISTPAESDLRMFKDLLAMSRGLSGILLEQVRQHDGEELSHLGLTFEDFAAIVTELEYKESMHFPRITQKRMAYVAEVFKQKG